MKIENRKTIESIKETQNCFLWKINKINKLLVGLAKKRRQNYKYQK